MNIADYASYFHDGSLIDIKQDHSTIILSIESAEISADENKDNILLSNHLTMKGKLHLDGVVLIEENEKPFSDHLIMLADSADILHLKIQGTKIRLDLEWMNFPPHPKITAYSFYIIHAEKIWWENIPNLFDPFW